MTHIYPLTQSAQAHVPLALTGVQRPQVQAFVGAFYKEVLQDALLAPIFDRVVAKDAWPVHTETMTDFWMAVAFGGAPFRGNPMVKHAQIRDIEPLHFERWLVIFTRVATGFWKPAIAHLLIFRAQQIAPALQRAVDRAKDKSIVTADDLR